MVGVGRPKAMRGRTLIDVDYSRSRAPDAGQGGLARCPEAGGVRSMNIIFKPGPVPALRVLLHFAFT